MWPNLSEPLLLWEWSSAGYCCSNTITYNMTLIHLPSVIKAVCVCVSSSAALNALLVSHKVSATHLGSDEALCVFSCTASVGLTASDVAFSVDLEMAKIVLSNLGFC